MQLVPVWQIRLCLSCLVCITVPCKDCSSGNVCQEHRQAVARGKILSTSLYGSAHIYTAHAKWGYRSCNNFCHHLGSVSCSCSLKKGPCTILYLINKKCMLTFLTLRKTVWFTLTSVSTLAKDLIFPISLHSADQGCVSWCKSGWQTTPQLCVFFPPKVALTEPFFQSDPETGCVSETKP